MTSLANTHADIHTVGSAPAPKPSEHGDTRHYMSGAGAISIAFLLELLKLNTEMKNDMASLSEQTTETQGKIIDTQAEAQKSFYDSQASELDFQMASTIAQAVSSGFQGVTSAAMGIGTRGASAEASQSQEQLESFNEINTQTDLFTGDEDPNTNFEDPYENGPHASNEHRANIEKLREQLAQGRFDASTFEGKSLHEAEVEINGTRYSVKDAIKTAKVGERKSMGEKFAKARDAANEKVKTAQQNWTSITSLMQCFMGLGTGSVDSWSKSAQASTKKDQGASQALTQEAQGTGTVLGNAQKTVSDARDAGASNITQTLQTLREIVASQVRG